MKCSICGENNEPGLKFCLACGHPLVPDAPASPGLEGEAALLPPGTVLKSTYEIIRPLGEGGAGTVYEGRHRDLGHPVAIKVLFGHLTRIPTLRQRFIEEGRIQANLRHPNIVQVHDIVDEGGQVAIVMEFVDGESLHSFIHRQPQPIPINFAIHCALRLLSGLSVAHASGVVHRDIKPANILLAYSDGGVVPKLCDFGIAKVSTARGRTATGTKMGTVHYMAPEQFQDARTVDSRADIYSLGVTLYELVTQRLPFESENDFAVIRAHLEVNPPSARSFRLDLPAELDRLLLKALAKRPEDRFESCDSMARAMVSLPGFETLKGYKSEPAIPEPRWSPARHGLAEEAATGEPRPPLSDRRPRAARQIPKSPVDGIHGENEALEPLTADRPRRDTVLDARRGTFPWFTVSLMTSALILTALVLTWSLLRSPEPAGSSAGSAAAMSGVAQQREGGTGPAVQAILVEGKPDEVESTVTSGRDLIALDPDQHTTHEITLEECRALVETVSEVAASLRPAGPSLVEDLDRAAESCRPLLVESVSGNPFELLWAQLQADRLSIARHLLRAGQEQSTEQRCLRLALANRGWERAVQRVEAVLAVGTLLEIEATPVRNLGLQLQEEQARALSRYPECRW